jgi:putrescine transport system substrate-binding protein
MYVRADPIRFLRGAALALAAFWTATALAETAPSPFAPAPKPEPQFLRLLAFADYFDPDALSEFERESGRVIAYDAYASPDAIPEMMREGTYDLVVLPGPALRTEIAAGNLQRIERSKLKNAGAVAPRILAKLAAYDPSGGYGLPYMWFATGLVFDADKIRGRLPAGPTSWGVIFSAEISRRFADCGVATPDDRDDLFMAAWRYLGVAPARVGGVEIKHAGDLLLRLKSSARGFATPDIVGALANGSVCLSMGRATDAEAATQRAKQSGLAAHFDFAIPREGAPMSLDALAIPKEATHLADAYALLDFLLRPDMAARDAKATGFASGDDGGEEEALKRLFPSGALEPTIAGLVEKEWARVRAAK